MLMASRFHPNWQYLTYGVMKLHARNCYQILGEDLKTPVDFVVCWTPGCRNVGGTSQTLRIAKVYKIKVFNLAKKEDFNFWHEKIL